jgi:hypothetical protein
MILKNVHIARNQPRINPWNPAIVSRVHPNRDVLEFQTVSMFLLLTYYIRNYAYATKDDASSWQVNCQGGSIKAVHRQGKCC